MDTPVKTGRDPVCESIESLLADLENEGKGELVRTEAPGSVSLCFGGLYAEAPTYDIALVRLAAVMVDEPKYARALMEVLRAPLHAAGPWHGS